MVLEAQSTLVVMLTTVVERGRTKCAQYWPDVGSTLDLGNDLNVTCNSEITDPSQSFVFREFVLRQVLVRKLCFCFVYNYLFQICP